MYMYRWHEKCTGQVATRKAPQKLQMFQWLEGSQRHRSRQSQCIWRTALSVEEGSGLALQRWHRSLQSSIQVQMMDTFLSGSLYCYFPVTESKCDKMIHFHTPAEILDHHAKLSTLTTRCSLLVVAHTKCHFHFTCCFSFSTVLTAVDTCQCLPFVAQVGLTRGLDILSSCWALDSPGNFNRY